MEFWVDFRGYCKVNADNAEKAEDVLLFAMEKLESMGLVKDLYWDVEGVEKAK